MPTATNTPTNTPVTPSPTKTQATAAVCGNGKIEAGEDCDEGGVCTGGFTAGTKCFADSDCGAGQQGVCLAGANAFYACDDDSDCPWSQCVRCKVFGGVPASNAPGKTCAANCTFESVVTYNLIPGVKVLNPDGTYSAVPGTTTSVVHPSNFFPIDPLGLTGYLTYYYGRQVNGQFPLRLPEDTPTHINSYIAGSTAGRQYIPVGSLSCACVRAVTDMTCGGVLVEKDGSAAIDCSPGWVQGTCSKPVPPTPPIVCYENDPGYVNGNGCFDPITPLPTLGKTPTPNATKGTPTWTPRPTYTGVPEGTCIVPDPCAAAVTATPGATPKPCAYVHGAGNTASGFVACNEVNGTNLYYFQDAGNTSPPAPPTPPAGSGPPVVNLRNDCQCTTNSDCASWEHCNPDGHCACTTLGSPLTISYDPTVLTFDSCTKAAGISAGKSVTTSVYQLSLSPPYNNVTVALTGDSVTIPDGDMIDCTFTVGQNAPTGPTSLLYAYLTHLFDDKSNDYWATGTGGSILVYATPTPGTPTPTNTPGAATPTSTPGGPRIAIGSTSAALGADVTVSISLAKQGANIVAVSGGSDCNAGETCVCPSGNAYKPLYPLQGPEVKCPTPNTGECIKYTGCELSSDCPGTEVCRPGPAGSMVIVNSTAIGLTPNNQSKCTITGTAPLTVVQQPYGPDRTWCTNDDPQAGRGTPQTLPQVTGFAAGFISNIFIQNSPPGIVGPFTQIGHTVDCSGLLAPTPSLSGGAVAGAFTALNQANIENDVTTNVFWAGVPTPTP